MVKADAWQSHCAFVRLRKTGTRIGIAPECVHIAWYFFLRGILHCNSYTRSWDSQLQKCRTDVRRRRRRRKRWRRRSATDSSVQENNYRELVRNKWQSSNLEIACLSRSYESLESWLLGNDSTSASYFRLRERHPVLSTLSHAWRTFLFRDRFAQL